MYAVKCFAVNAIPAYFVRVFAAPYVAGDSLEKALATADGLYRNRGICTTMDVLGEMEKERGPVRKAVDLYLETAATLKDRPYSTISVKPGHFGYYVDPKFCKDNIEELAIKCQAQGTGLTVDMEDTDLTDFTIRLYQELKPKYPVLGTVLQSRLFRTEKDVDALDGLNAHIRLCIGIYNVPATLAYTKKRDIKNNWLKLLRKLFERGHYVCLATHDVEYLGKAREIIAEMKVPKDRYELQMLLGVPRDRVQHELVSSGEKVRLYVPFAANWADAIAYLRRRMIENPFMAGLVLKNIVRRN